jgi:segregation and condensation protein A
MRCSGRWSESAPDVQVDSQATAKGRRHAAAIAGMRRMPEARENAAARPARRIHAANGETPTAGCRNECLMSTEALQVEVPSSSPDAQPHAAGGPRQQEMPLAVVRGQPVLELPQDLYIPPDALEVILEAFEGPLDLLLYLIRRQNLEILDIPVAEITRQYMEYIAVMRELRLELAAEYLVMAAILAEIKSRLLLPRPPADEADEQDPRAELIRRLQDYERFKKAADDLDSLPRMERDTDVAQAFVPDRKVVRLPPAVDLKEMLLALKDVLHRAELFGHHAVQREPLSVRQRMGDVLRKLGDGAFHRFESLFSHDEGRLGVVVTFLALLELSKDRLVDIMQETPLAAIYLKARATEASE